MSFDEPARGQAAVTLAFGGFDLEESYFTVTGDDPGYHYEDVRFRDVQGRTVPHERRGERFLLGHAGNTVVAVDYRVVPGVWGRHGRQGTITADWATLDGRIFLMPAATDRLRAVRVRFATPSGWTIASPFRRKGEWYYPDGFGPEHAAETLSRSCVGAGRFDVTDRRFGDMEVRVATHLSWDRAYRDELTAKTFALMETFHERLGFDLGAPYSIVWSPTWFGRRVYGGAHSNGNCLEHPEGGLRNWQLLAHRIAHAMNKYPPSGMKVRDAENRWFVEGWPSYMEVRATREAGIARDESYWNELYRTYRSDRSERPDLEVPLAEREQPDAHIHQHYRKAPLVLRMLDELMIDRGGRTIEEFMHAMWQRYGWFRAPFALKEELEAFTGASFDDFWSMAVRRRGEVIPAWPEFVTPAVEAAMRIPPAAHVGGDPVSGDYLFFLARSGRFASYREIREFVIAAVRRRQVLGSRGVRLYAPEIAEHLFALPPADRYAIALYEASHPAADEPASGPPLELVPDTAQPDGKAFADLLRLEAETDALGGGNAAHEISVRVGSGAAVRFGPPRLAFGVDATLLLEVEWPAAAERAELDVRSGNRPIRRFPLPRGLTHDYRRLTPEDRADDAVVVVRALDDGRPVAGRVFWQRGREPASRPHRTTTAARESLESARAAVARDPSDPAALYRQAVALAMLGRNGDAAEAFSAVLELTPDDANVWNRRGLALLETDEHEEALRSFDRALALDPGLMSVRANRAVALARCGRRAEALAELDETLDRWPDPPARHSWVGRVRMALGEYREALVSNREFVELVPNNAAGWRILGSNLMRLGRYQESVAAYDRALELDPDFGVAEAEREEAFRSVLRP